ncbi:hypothetical protein PGT21_027421 [Puccinia graminis f. sp. tritici]|uniref:Uncharacterized protein n=1 Tax=Puccinia graminis f. sp. tritici TaxID=56615 RepID=A0A5B0NR80_PUCGR|nr:hypothetical protein PGTUg99_016268 [Puccinia graminis f. sp. tritici]KAA1091162.1 hypothetical protein PGT21_027421 [Puccinia graminis f. sp. tritici]
MQNLGFPLLPSWIILIPAANRIMNLSGNSDPFDWGCRACEASPIPNGTEVALRARALHASPLKRGTRLKSGSISPSRGGPWSSARDPNRDRDFVKFEHL